MRFKLLLLFFFSIRLVNAQSVELTTAFGPSQFNISGSYIKNVFKYKKFRMGLGPRITGITTNNVDHITAGPAKYTRTFTAPFAIVFAGQSEENFDTLQVKNASLVSTNIALHFGFQFSKKWYAGTNIDFIGFTLGGKKRSLFKGTNQYGIAGTFDEFSTTPTVFNVLPTGDHDRGTLNSEFLAKYQIKDKWAIKGVFQFLFIEYQTNNIQQRIDNGVLLNRFRNKANNFGLGVAYSF